ncbi:Endonuclease/Exonuclease/phosphatase family protein [Tritrichomonas foetus]|uniref:Endonuclease/Exonuclease/phosphatase family protein n=1 Tax=Tritrichomonas foetus TaxID=1144522 RepID=A0A1J4JS03_9EUKA|nr:Endonuclease/Exonuclease/phosphatase family protein [Tritrichomonas foetus]|eukprot:OHT01919.1 Endonuclease/Exonuclease/phosphatase family protein [Tritrichomonas foetus]
MNKLKISDFGPVTIAIPIASSFEAANFESTVKDKTNIRIISWPTDASGKETFNRLTHIKCLDMHGISLTNIPPEIGLCTELEYLDVSDNCLESLPPELSQCSKLQTLIYSGNSLPYKSQIQALIDLRQLNQSVSSAPSFKWTQPNAAFTMISWNVLCDNEAKQYNFPKTPTRFLSWEYRSDLFIHTILNLKPHLVCIQEIEGTQLNALSDRMRTIGYGCASSFASRPRRPGLPVVGVATFFLKARLTVEKTVSVSFSDLAPNEHISKLQLIANDAAFQVSVVRLQAQSFFLVNAGLRACRYEPEVLLAQVAIIAQRVDGLTSQALICGSLGFKPGSAPHTLLTSGTDPSGKFKLKRTFRSAYADASVKNEFTVWDEDGFSTTDYIWISQMMQPTGFVIVPTIEEAQAAHRTAPNSQWPSNHIPIGAAIDIKTSPQELYY